MRAKRRMFRKDKKGVSEVIAVILMVAITVVLAGVLYVWVDQMSATSSGIEAQISTTSKMQGKSYLVSIAANYGDALPLSDTKITLYDDNGAVEDTGLCRKADVWDDFNTKDTSTWKYNSHQTVPYSLGTDNVVWNAGTGSSWGANFYRSKYTIWPGDHVYVEFKVDQFWSVAHYAIERGYNGVYYRWCAIAGNTIYVQYRDASGWHYPKNLINPLKVNAWYCVYMGLGKDGTYTIAAWEKNNPSNYGEYTHTMPTNFAWRFHHWIYRHNAYITRYIESGSDVASYTGTANVYIAGPHAYVFDNNKNDFLDQGDTIMLTSAGVSSSELGSWSMGIQIDNQVIYKHRIK